MSSTRGHGFRRRLRAGVAMLLTWVATPLVAQDWLAVYGERPVPVRMDGIVVRDLDLLTLVDGELELRPVGETGAARVLVPLAEAGRIRLQVRLSAEWQSARDRLAEGQYAEAIALMRPTVYPLVRYIEVPPELLPSQDFVRDFMSALLVAGELNEAVRLLGRLPLAQLDPAFLDLTLQVLNRLVQADRAADVQRLLGELPSGRDLPGWNARLLHLAGQWRLASRWPESLALYERVVRTGTAEESAQARLWVAYGHVLQGDTVAAERALAAFAVPTREDLAYPLYELVRARLALAHGDGEAALEAAAPAVVYAAMTDEWAAELRQVTAEAYVLTDRPTVALAIWEEILVFYPGSPWAPVARDALQRLRPPPPEAATAWPVDPAEPDPEPSPEP